MKRTLHLLLGLLLGILLVAATLVKSSVVPWSQAERETIRSLWIGSLPVLPPDPTNRYGDDSSAAALVHRLFFDPRLSASGTVSCATCHQPERDFQDDRPLSVGVGRTNRRAMPIAGTAHSPWLFWDGRKDSQWAQALGPLESPVEHGGTRLQYVHVVAAHYSEAYEAVFGPLPDLSALPPTGGPVAYPVERARWAGLSEAQREAATRVFVNIGKAIAAYERTLQFGLSRFDHYAAALATDAADAGAATLSADEVAGLRLFIGKGQCINCHNGPLFTDNHFHNTGVPALASLPEDLGRATGAVQVRTDEFNCESTYSDASEGNCAELRYMVVEGPELRRAFKAPTLRNAALRPPYMHAGQFATLAAVLDHYNRAPAAPAGHSELRPLKLSKQELRQLEAFLRTLATPISAPEGFLTKPIVPTSPTAQVSR